MKISNVFEVNDFTQGSASDQLLSEVRLRDIIMATALGLAPGVVGTDNPDVTQTKKIQPINQHKDDTQHLIKLVASKYKNIDYKLASQIVSLAKKYEYASFPKAKDLLAIIGIESSFNPEAKSSLKKDPAVGLTQIRPEVWGLKAGDLKGNIEKQIATGADILNKYYTKLGDKHDAIHAYNVGMTNFKRGTGLNPDYVNKFANEREMYGDYDKPEPLAPTVRPQKQPQPGLKADARMLGKFGSKLAQNTPASKKSDVRHKPTEKGQASPIPGHKPGVKQTPNRTSKSVSKIKPTLPPLHNKKAR